jgi:hypothetical protein
LKGIPDGEEQGLACPLELGMLVRKTGPFSFQLEIEGTG